MHSVIDFLTLEQVRLELAELRKDGASIMVTAEELVEAELADRVLDLCTGEWLQVETD